MVSAGMPKVTSVQTCWARKRELSPTGRARACGLRQTCPAAPGAPADAPADPPRRRARPPRLPTWGPAAQHAARAAHPGVRRPAGRRPRGARSRAARSKLAKRRMAHPAVPSPSRSAPAPALALQLGSSLLAVSLRSYLWSLGDGTYAGVSPSSVLARSSATSSLLIAIRASVSPVKAAAWAAVAPDTSGVSSAAMPPPAGFVLCSACPVPENCAPWLGGGLGSGAVCARRQRLASPRCTCLLAHARCRRAPLSSFP
jgi:hypothetical protein